MASLTYSPHHNIEGLPTVYFNSDRAIATFFRDLSHLFIYLLCLTKMKILQSVSATSPED